MRLEELITSSHANLSAGSYVGVLIKAVQRQRGRCGSRVDVAMLFCGNYRNHRGVFLLEFLDRDWGVQAPQS